ncbi:hypothetical protein HDU91_002528, partial [Kappamyces sp. JEL0680]
MVDSTFCYLVGRRQRRILIDAGNGNPAFAGLVKETLALHRSVVQGVCKTHSHHNHNGDPSFDALFPPLALADKTAIEGLEAVATPGHSDDHYCLFLESESALFSGDAIRANPAGHALCRAIYSDLHSFKKSLKRLQGLGPRLIFPAHDQPIFDGLGYLEQTLETLDQIDARILGALATGANSVKNLLVQICREARIGNGTDALIFGGTLRLHLLRLERMGLVKRADSS